MVPTKTWSACILNSSIEGFRLRNQYNQGDIELGFKDDIIS